MSIKVFCDRCGDEAKAPFRATIIVNPDAGQDTNWAGDLCGPCSLTLRQWPTVPPDRGAA